MQSRYLTADEVTALAREAGEGWLPFAVALCTGLRIGDVLKIREEDLRAEGVSFVAEKTGKSGFAALPVPILRALRKNAAGGWCFPSPKASGKHLTRQAAWARLKRAADRAGIPAAGVSPHALRKCFAVERMRSGGLADVQTALQHTGVKVTELYAFSDWLTGENANLPLLRGDVMRIADKVAEVLQTKIADLLRGA